MHMWILIAACGKTNKFRRPTSRCQVTEGCVQCSCYTSNSAQLFVGTAFAAALLAKFYKSTLTCSTDNQLWDTNNQIGNLLVLWFCCLPDCHPIKPTKLYLSAAVVLTENICTEGEKRCAEGCVSLEHKCSKLTFPSKCRHTCTDFVKQNKGGCASSTNNSTFLLQSENFVHTH